MSKIILAFVVCTGFLAISYGLFYWFLKNPSFSFKSVGPFDKADSVKLRAHVEYLAGITPARNSKNLASLNKAADYIKREFTKHNCHVTEQVFRIQGNDYKNIICTFGPKDGQRVILGAHYDVYLDNNPGADDNASGVAGILELARILTEKKPNLTHRLDLVAYTLEEQPHFSTHTMGSFVHAQSLVQEQADIKLMVSVEMIGYFSDKPGSQFYPLSFLKVLYPGKGNFIGVIGKSFDRHIVMRAKNLMTVSDELPVRSINAPSFIPGIDLSDHRNFWHFKLPAVMVTDTAFLRNPHYHKSTDTPDTLDYDKMKLVVDGLYRIAVEF